MDLHAWLDRPDNKGRASWLAAELGVTDGALSQWRDRGVPMRHMRRIEELTGGAVTVEAMLQYVFERRTEAA